MDFHPEFGSAVSADDNVSHVPRGEEKINIYITEVCGESRAVSRSLEQVYNGWRGQARETGLGCFCVKGGAKVRNLTDSPGDLQGPVVWTPHAMPKEGAPRLSSHLAYM